MVKTLQNNITDFSPEFIMQARRGLVDGVEVVNLDGFHDNTGDAAFETLWNQAGVILWDPIAGAFPPNVIGVISTDALSDDGVVELTIKGLDANWNPIEETIVCGQSGTLNYHRINSVVNTSNTKSVGNISVVFPDLGNFVVFTVDQDYQRVTGIAYSVPAGYSALVFNYRASTKEKAEIEIRFGVRSGNDTFFREGFPLVINTIIDANIDFVTVPEKSDMQLTVRRIGGTAGDGDVSCSVSMLLIKN